MSRATQTNPAPDTPPSFEQAYQRLEEIVAELETGGLTLDQMLARFEEGMRLSTHCTNCLDTVEKRVELVTRTADGHTETSPLDLPE